MNIPQTPPPVVISKIEAQDLHNVWSWVRGGIYAVIKKAAPVDWIAEDIYAAIRFNHASLYLVTRGPRTVGFFISYTQRRAFSNKLEYFLWCAYTIPLRERLPDDNVPEAVALSIDFMRNQARQLGCDRVVTITRRPSYRRFGFTPGFTTWEMPV